MHNLQEPLLCQFMLQVFQPGVPQTGGRGCRDPLPASALMQGYFHSEHVSPKGLLGIATVGEFSEPFPRCLPRAVLKLDRCIVPSKKADLFRFRCIHLSLDNSLVQCGLAAFTFVVDERFDLARVPDAGAGLGTQFTRWWSPIANDGLPYPELRACVILGVRANPFCSPFGAASRHFPHYHLV